MRTLHRLGNLLMFVAVVSAACGKDSPTQPTSPSLPATGPASSCAFSVGALPDDPIAASGGEFTVPVTTDVGCAWTAAPAASFITAVDGGSGTGSGSVKFAVQSNNGAEREGALQIANRMLNVVQLPAPDQLCAFDVSPRDVTIGPQGGDIQIAVSIKAGTNCEWRATATSAFVSVTGPAAGTASGTTTLAIGTNTGPTRPGFATIGGRTITILQTGSTPSTCALTVAPTQITAPATSGTVTVNVTRTQGSGCAWIAQAQASWLSVTGGSSGADSGSVKVAMTANTDSAARVGTVLVADQVVTVTQNPVAASPSTCVFDVDPLGVSAPAAGGTSAIAVVLRPSTDQSCAWTATSQSSFITANPASGVGTGHVTLTIAPNSGSARTGTVRIANSVVSVTQTDSSGVGCVFSMPSQVTMGQTDSSMITYITQTQGGPNCVWTAQSSASWLTFLGNSSGVGTGAFMIRVATNTGPQRAATVTAGGRTLTVTQDGGVASGNMIAVLSFTSDAGHSVGRGNSQTVTMRDNEFNVILDSARSQIHLSTTVAGAWQLRLQGPSGQTLVPGLYDKVGRSPFMAPGQPGLDFSGGGHGCNTVTGRFVIAEATFGSGNTIQRFHAAFEHHCNNSSPALYGQIWIDAAGAPPPAAPAFPPTPSTPTSFLNIQSGIGDPVGNGQTVSYTLSATTPFGALLLNNGRELNSSAGAGFGATWSVNLAAPAGQQLLPGTYLNASALPVITGTAPGMRISGGNGSGCSTIGGQFVVLEAVYGPNGEVYRFHATFEQYCNSATVPLRGEIRIVADPWR